MSSQSFPKIPTSQKTFVYYKVGPLDQKYVNKLVSPLIRKYFSSLVSFNFRKGIFGDWLKLNGMFDIPYCSFLSKQSLLL